MLRVSRLRPGQGYHSHLFGDESREALEIRPSDGRAGSLPFRRALQQILDLSSEDLGQWCYSFVGPLVKWKLLSAWSILADHQLEAGAKLSEICFEIGEGIPFSELAFTASKEVLAELLNSSEITFGWEMSFFGWCLNDKSRLLDFKVNSEGKLQYPPQAFALVMASAPDWDSVEFHGPKVPLIEQICLSAKQQSV